MHPHPPASAPVFSERGSGRVKIRARGRRRRQRRQLRRRHSRTLIPCSRRRTWSPISGGAAVAMDFPVAPMDRLPILPDEAASAAALIELIGGVDRAEKESANGSHGAVVGGFGRSSAGQFGGGAMYGEETSVAAGGVSTQMPLTRAVLKHILMEIRTLLFKIEQKVAMEALLNRLARWLPKPLDGLRVNCQFDKTIVWGLLADGGESCGPEAFCGWPGIEHDQASKLLQSTGYLSLPTSRAQQLF